MEQKIKRYYHRIKSGLFRANCQHKHVRFFTLTTSIQALHVFEDSHDRVTSPVPPVYSWYVEQPDGTLLHKTKLPIHTSTLMKRITRKFGKPEYVRVETNEGNGVVHILYTDHYIPQRWLSYNWNDIHSSPNVDIRSSRQQDKLASYLASQYLSKQKCTFTRLSTTKNWIFSGACKVWKNLIDNEKNQCYFNSVQDKYYYKRQEISFSEILQKALLKWNNIIYSHTYSQLCLTDFS